MIRRAVLALLLFAALLGLGVAGLWAAGWLPGQRSGPEVASSTPAPSPEPVGVPPTVVVPPLPAPEPVPPEAATPEPISPTPATPPSPPPAPTRPFAITPVNAVRALAGVAAVTGEPHWVEGCAAHARYLVRADRGEHREDPASPHRTATGETCAAGHYFVSSQADSGAERAVAYWATGAFHLPQLIDPRLIRVALGVAHDDSGTVQSAAVLDVQRGLEGTGTYPVRFPAPGRVSPYTVAAASEWPDPTPSCPGFVAPLGAPVALLLGPDTTVRNAALKVNGRPVTACLLTAQTFQGGAEADTQAGRNVLAAQGAAVLLPRRPLPAGAAVRVSFVTTAGRVSWAFRVR